MPKDEYTGSNVKRMTRRDFKTRSNGQTYINTKKFSGKPGLVKFYAPWCPHCQVMVPTMKKLAKTLKPYSVNIGAVNCDNVRAKNDQLAGEVGVDGFPSLYVVKKSGRLVPYEGGRDAKSIMRGLEKYL